MTDPKPLYRREHPEESRLGAEHIAPGLSDLHAEVLDAIKARPGLTASEMATEWSQRDTRRYGRRLGELEKAGLAHRTEGVCRVTSRPAARWWPGPSKAPVRPATGTEPERHRQALMCPIDPPRELLPRRKAL